MMDHAVINGVASSRDSNGFSSNGVPTDALLPQLAVILDPEAMKDRLREQLFASPQERERFLIRACEIAQVRYKPESSCMVTYRLEIEDAMTRETGEQILCGRAYPEGRSQSQWGKAQLRAVVQPRFGKPLLYLPDLEMVLWSFPNDRKMDMLPTLADAGHFMSAILPKMLATHLGEEWTLTGSNRTLIQYVGEHKCTVRIDATVAHQDDHRRQTITLFEKTYYNGEGEETFRVMHQLWQSEARRTGRLVIAKPVRYDPSLKTLWQLGLSGTNLIDLDMKRPEFCDLLSKAASAVGSLHTATLISSKTVRLADTLVSLEKNRHMLPQVAPACRKQLHSLIDHLALQAECLEEHSVATLHGDLQLENVLVDGDQVALIDLDTLCKGDPLFDVGSFVAFVIYRGILSNMYRESIEEMCEVFIRQYEKSVPWVISRPALRWHIAAALINERTARCVTRLKAGRLVQMDALINYAQNLCCE